MLGQALQLMLYGLIGVFAALTVLYLGIRLITAVFPYKEGKE